MQRSFMWNHYLNFAQTNYKRWYQYFLSGTSEYQEFFTGLEVVCSQIAIIRRPKVLSATRKFNVHWYVRPYLFLKYCKGIMKIEFKMIVYMNTEYTVLKESLEPHCFSLWDISFRTNFRLIFVSCFLLSLLSRTNF